MQPPFPLSSIPAKPGCYLYKDKTEKIIYIGKAKNLRKRVSQYFQRDLPDLKTQRLVKNILSVNFFITKNEHEALVLEANLIRKHKPRYNIDLKNGRRYAYILITKEKYPRLLTARDTEKKGDYYGPFTSGYLRTVLLRTLRKTFFIRTCKTLPKKPCLRYHIGLCKAPCVGKQTVEEYNEAIDEIRQILRGNSVQVEKKLQQHMKKLAKQQHYEEAKDIRDQLLALEQLKEEQEVERAKGEEDVISYIETDTHYLFMVFSVRGGMLGDRDEYTLEKKEVVGNVLEEFIKRYYEDKGTHIPSTILIPELVDETIADYLSEKAEKTVDIKMPQRGAKKGLLDLVKKNIEVLYNAPTKAGEELKKHLGLETMPRTIECFDISHLAGTNIVASMVQFKDGKPSKKNYRKFKIKTVLDNDDFRSMREVVYRRYKRLVEEKKELPDLIVIDGGEQQLAFAQEALQAADVTIPIIGLAKKLEEIYVLGKKTPYQFDKKMEMMKLLTALRDEAHRFAITYQRSLRKKELKK